MKKERFTIIQKIGLAALGLVSITLFTIFLANKARELRLKREPPKSEPIIEGFDFPSIDDISKSINSGLNSAKDAILGPINDIIDAIESIFTGIPNLGKGIVNHMKCGSEEAKEGGKYGLEIFGIILACAWDKHQKFFDGSCTRYYLIDIIFGMFYGIFIELPLLLIYAITGLDLQFIIDLVLEIVILPLDTVIYAISGFHIIQWPDSVIKDCYRCAGTMDVGDGNGRQTLHKTMGEWGAMLNCTTHEFIHGVSTMIFTLVPSAWPIWWGGQHLDGGDNFGLL